MAQKTVIDGLLDRFESLFALLISSKEISFAVEAEANFKKLLLLACGSFFEEQITGMLEAFAFGSGDERLGAFVRHKALKRQYHTLFVWDGPQNVNSFLGLFGDEFKASVSAKIVANKDLGEGVRSFLWVGQRRNQLAHGNVAALPVDETREEIVGRYRSAWSFVRFVAGEFGQTCSADVADEGAEAEARPVEVASADVAPIRAASGQVNAGIKKTGADGAGSE